MGILFVPIALAVKLGNLLLWLVGATIKFVIVALRLVLRFEAAALAAVFTTVGSTVLAVLPGKKKVDGPPPERYGGN